MACCTFLFIFSHVNLISKTRFWTSPCRQQNAYDIFVIRYKIINFIFYCVQRRETQGRLTRIAWKGSASENKNSLLHTLSALFCQLVLTSNCKLIRLFLDK